MKLLLDTHIWLWMQVAPGRLNENAIDLISDTANELYLSAASSWEIAIKYALGRLPLPTPPAEYVASRMLRSGTSGMPVEHRHALHVASLPEHHRDPFDRLLIAQAQLERAHLVSSDSQLARYDVDLIHGS